MSIEQTQTRPIIAAVNSTAPSAAALRWGASEACRRRTRLTVIHVDHPDLRTDSRLERDPVGTSTLTREGVARRVAGWLGPAAEEVDVTIQTIRGSLDRVLTRASRGAQLIVLGSTTCRGHAHLAAELAPCVDAVSPLSMSPDVPRRCVLLTPARSTERHLGPTIATTNGDCHAGPRTDDLARGLGTT